MQANDNQPENFRVPREGGANGPNAPHSTPPIRYAGRKSPRGLIVLATLVAIIAVCEWLEWPFLRAPIQLAASSALDRPVTVGAPFGMRFVGPLRVHAESLVIGPASDWPAGAPSPDLLNADRLRVAVPYATLIALLLGHDPSRGNASAKSSDTGKGDSRQTPPNADDRRPHIKALEVERLRVRLVRTADGRANWHFGEQRVDDQPPAAIPRFDRLAIDKGELSVDDAVGRVHIRAELRTREQPAEAGQAAGEPGIEASAEGRFRDQELWARASAGGLSALAGSGNGSAQAPVRIEFRSGPVELDFDGWARDVRNLGGLDGKFRLAGPSLAAVGAVVGLTLPTTAQFSMRGRARKEGEVWSADIGELAVGRSRLAGDFRYDPTPAVPKLTGKLGGALLSLPDLGPAVGAPPTKPGVGKEKRTEDKVAENKNAEDRPASSTEKSAGNDKQRGSGQTQVSGSADAAPNGGSEAGPAERDPNAKRPTDETAGRRTTPTRRVLPQKEFNTPSLAAMEADVQIELQEFDLGTAQLEELKPFHGHLTLHDRVLTLEKLKAGAAGGEMSGVISFDARAKTPQWNADLGWAGVQLQRFVKPRDVVGRDPQSGYVSGALSGRARLSGHGRSTAAILGSLEGGVQLWVRDGTISHLLVEALGIDVAQALGVLVRGDAQLQMNCAVTSMSVRDGRMEPDVALIETKDSTLTTTGFISLADERFGLEFRAHPKDISPMTLRSPLYVEGTFSDPAIRIDKRRIGLRVAAAAALAAVTPIAGALALIDLGDSERDACQKAYARVQSPTPASRPGNRTPR